MFEGFVTCKGVAAIFGITVKCKGVAAILVM